MTDDQIGPAELSRMLRALNGVRAARALVRIEQRLDAQQLSPSVREELSRECLVT